MNILLLNWRDPKHPKSGGAETVSMEHARQWAKVGSRVTWLTSSFRNGSSEEYIGKVRIIRRWGSLTIYLYAPWFLLFHAKEYDVIVDEVHGIPFFSPLFTRKPVVVFIHEIAGEIWDFMYPFPISKIGKMLERWYFRLYRRYLFWTDAPSTVDDLARRGISGSQCFAIPCPMSIDKEIMRDRGFRNNHKSKERFPTFLFVSRVVRMKGIEEVIKAFSFIVKERPDARLWIIGGGDERYKKQLEMMIRDYGVHSNVTFWGKVSEKKKFELMARGHVLLHASVKEGWGLVVLEAARMGTPSVVYNVPGLCDVVKNGKTGIVLKDNSPDTMAREALSLYMDKKRYALYQRNGIAWADSFTWENAAKLSLELLRKAKELTL